MEKITLNLKKWMFTSKNWIRENTLEFWILVAILVVGAFCRLYKIDQYMTFLGDEGRDVIIVRRLLTEAHPPLIGPGTSIGNMYLGPLYYYIMAPALLLAAFSPVGPAIEIALLGIVTVWLVWYVGREWFDKTAGLIAAGLYAVSPVVIIYSRSSWNPNIMPFFALLSMYSIWKVWSQKNFKWLLVLGIAFTASLQSHYLALLLLPTIGIFWLLTILDLKKNRKWKMESRDFIKKSIYAFLIFLVLMSPLFFFDLRHNWINFRAIYTFFTVRQTTVSIRPWTALPKVPAMLNQINTSVVGGKSELAGEIVSFATILLLGYLVWQMFKKKNYTLPTPYYILFSWFGFGLVGFGLYKQNIYDHYFGLLFAVPPLLIGLFVTYLLRFGKVGKVLGTALVVYLVFLNLVQNPLKDHPNNQLGRAADVARKIEQESGGMRFNLGVIAERNYEDGYKYFLLKDDQPVIGIDSQSKDSITDQLFVVCELEKSKCDPTHNPSAAVANFGWSKVENQWEIDGVQLYKLLHSK